MANPRDLVTGAAEVSSPVRAIDTDDLKAPTDGWALSLSGGGYRAMLFHLGVLWRLNDARWLNRLDRISSVSGGSITSGVLGANWRFLDFDDEGFATAFRDVVATKVHEMAGKHVDVTSILRGIASPFSTIGDRVAEAYDDTLFHGETLQGLPDRPVFIFNATNLESGALMRFTKNYVADWRVGRIAHPEIRIATAVASSSAFPPFLSPYHLDLTKADWVTDPGNDLTGEEYRSEISLSDGGVYDNLGIETVWKRCRGVIVSDAGGQMGPESHPHDDWGRHMLRVLEVIDHQVRSLRKRQVIDGLARGDRVGTYIGIRSHVEDYALTDPMPADPAMTDALARTPTRLDKLPLDRQRQLVNWGYVICDTGLRKHVDTGVAPGALPYPDAPI